MFAQMAMRFRFPMVKLMRTKAGYTFLEMLICIVLLSILSVITMGTIPINQSESLCLEKINQLIIETRSAAILQNKDVQIVFEPNYISNGYSSLKLSNSFMKITGKVTYNGDGHIDRGDTVRFCQHHCYDIIFNVGNGAYHIEKV